MSESAVLHLNSFELLQIIKTVKNPFSRENFMAKVKPNFGEGSFVWYNLGNGIASYTYAYELLHDTVATLSSDVSGAVLVFNLGDDFTHEYKNGTKYVIKKNSFFIGFSSRAFEMHIRMLKNKSYKTVNIGIKEELLLRLIANYGDIYTKMVNDTLLNGYAILEGGEIDGMQMEILKLFPLHEMDEDLLNVLKLEGHIMHLVHDTIVRIMRTMHKMGDLNLDIAKINSLERARNIIYNEYDKALSIKQIAYRSAINECYLKKDFKAYYGMTVYEMLQTQRLEMAKKLLKDDASVREVSSKVGYKHAGHFSKLFTERFGISPSVYRKRFS
ncbi:helix-turn-helix domain-containing protein [Sulfurospirillum barnesii]|uniref:helix-turn-helix domain-containing protein n=1 Tax=Sulfurospirillum barnesii TaxID=44674 RepID=UPI0002EEB486|nr:AraC family transcriptional regulator [Sulfurospirillum barnesii]